MKNFFILNSIIFIIIILPHSLMADKFIDEKYYAKAKITSIDKEAVKQQSKMNIVRVKINMTILTGEFKGEKKSTIFGGESDLPQNISYKVGETYFIGISKNGSNNKINYVSIYDVDNTNNIILLGIILFLIIIIIGKLKGLSALFALIATIALIFTILIPLTLKGYPPLPIAVGISILSIIITLPVIAGFHTKTLAAMAGASIGVIFASILAIGIGSLMNLSGIITDELITVFYLADVTIDLKGVMLAGMIIAALGAVMDIAISIASATAEIFQTKQDIDPKEAYKSVLNIGTDILGTMVNTLILAYVGSSLALILIISMKIQPEMPFWMVLNYNPVLSEIVKSIVGSIGMFISIPITAYISVKMYRKKWIKSQN